MSGLNPREIGAIERELVELRRSLTVAKREEHNIVQHLRKALQREALEELAEMSGLAEGERLGAEIYHASHGGSVSGLLWATGEILMMFPGGVAKSGLKFLKRIPKMHAMLIAVEAALKAQRRRVMKLEHRIAELESKARSHHPPGLHPPGVRPPKTRVYGHRNARPKETPPPGMKWKFTAVRTNIIRDSRGNPMAHHPDMGHWDLAPE